MPLKIIALGNRLRGDDAIGPVLLDNIEMSAADTDLKLIDAGSDAFLVLEHLMEKDPVLILDCARMNRQPGTVMVFSAQDAEIRTTAENIVLHGFSLAEIIEMAGKLGQTAPLRIVGIEPESVDFNQPLSATLNKQLPFILNKVLEEAKNYA